MYEFSITDKKYHQKTSIVRSLNAYYKGWDSIL